MSENAKLASGGITGHLYSQTAPMIVGVAAMMSIGLVDAYFIGQLGSTPLAAIAFIFPITVAISSLGVGVMVGINSVVSRALGAGDMDRAHRRASFGILFAIAIGIVFAVALYSLADPLFRLMQADPETLPLIRTYIQPFALGLPLLLATMGVNGVMRAQGEARKTLMVSLTFAITNWILDPILITGAFGFEGFGIAGAAYATIIGWACGVACAFWLLGRTKLTFRPRYAARTDPVGSTKEILKVAAPAAFSNAINPIGLSVLTALVAIEGQAAVAGFGAAGRLQSFAVVPLLALSGSIGAIVGQNWGANKPERAREAFAKAAMFCVIYGLATALILALTADYIAGFFTDEKAVRQQFVSYVYIAAWGYAGFGLLIVGNGVLNAVDRASFALLQSAARVFLIMMPFAWLMRGSMGADAIYTAELIANIVGGACAVLLVWWTLKAKSALH
ncbi:MATE family efflux transporter [Qipengyuania sp. DGS5-3]|uniref:MATE family efflux transporter n=1 Tax=Qipengyuania sp. DGS5-3 TaxID=3349632 RepID=UPI0036D27C0E